MTRNQLIAAVAIKQIKTQLDNESRGTLRICMIGLEPSIVRAIANSAKNDINLSSKIMIRINSKFDPHHELDESIRSDESITHWRHYPLPNATRAVLFATTQVELQRNQKSVEKITKIETDSLRTFYADWISQSGLSQDILDESSHGSLLKALKAANETNIARTIELFADFVLKIAEATISKGMPLQKAIDYALPKLRLPRNSGQFDSIAENRRSVTSEWAKIFKILHRKTRPFLYRENERGEPIDEVLLKNFEKMKSQLDDSEKMIIQTFLKCDVTHHGWTSSQEDLVNLDWNSICEVFEGPLENKEVVPLGKRTIDFFKDEFENPLDDEHHNLLIHDFPKNPTEELSDFFQEHQEQISRNKKIYNDWEKYIYGNLEPFDDFLAGLIATFYHLIERTNYEDIVENRIIVKIPRSERKSFWESKNSKIVRYFAVRYRGIQNFFDEKVRFDFGKLNRFYISDQIDKKIKNNSRSRDARRLKFEVELDPEGVKAKLMFIWEMSVDALATGMFEDLKYIANENGSSQPLLTTADIAKQSVSSKGKIQFIDLNDINTIRDVNNRNEGSMVAPNSENGDRTQVIQNVIEDLSKYISADQSDKILDDFNQFKESYGQAIRDWVGNDGIGISSDSLINQAESYGSLLNSLQGNANNDRARSSLWKECLRIGVANIDSTSPAAIILPWHPLRLAQIHIKAYQVAELIKSVLDSKEEDIYRADLLFRQKEKELLSNYYPEVCISLASDKTPTLLCITESKYDYSLAQSPQNNENRNLGDLHDDNPNIAAQAFSSVAEQFLTLLPHEQNNFSIVLYNTESKLLPKALENELSKKVERERDLQCDLLLTHTDLMRIRKVYEQQNATVDDDSGSVRASEADRNFLSRLRVGFLELGDLHEEDIRSFDIVALQDVIARSARVVWKKAPIINKESKLLEHNPSAWTRTKPTGMANTTATVYLAAPIQPKVGQIYLDTLYNYLLGENAKFSDAIPAHEVNFLDPKVRDVFKVAHQIGEWVVNFDKLVDRRFLINNNIDVIRHIYDQNVDRNITVSTKSGQRLLHTLIKKRLNKIDQNILKLRGEPLIKKLIDKANKLSGQVVMRAARHGQYANELLGIVLSMKLIKKSFRNESLSVGWYFLDDYASWFGQREEQIADIMAIAPHFRDGQHSLMIAIAESKFVSYQGYRSHAKKSARQLSETILRIARALDPRHNRIDRDMWLGRIGNFIINGMDQIEPTDNGWDLHQWSDKIRQDKVPIILSGLSYVFVHDNGEYHETDEPIPLNKIDHCYQQILFKHRVSDELKSFGSEEVDAIDAYINEDNIWTKAMNSALPESLIDESKRNESQKNININTQQRTPQEEEKAVAQETASRLDPVHKIAKNLDNGPLVLPVSTNSRWPSKKLSQWISKGISKGDDKHHHWMGEIVKSLRRALRGYDMSAELMGSRMTPNAALVRLRGSNDLTVTKVEKRRQEFLTSHGINVINVIPAPGEVIIMVERPQRAVLYLRDLWHNRELPESAPEINTSLLLGEHEADGKLIYLNVGEPFAGYHTHGPHTLIAGETGSGKGVLVQCLLLDICATNSPTNARIRMIDPKAGIDFPWLHKIPHLDNDIITTQQKAIETLNELVEEMNRRYQLLAKIGATKLANYNKKVSPSERLPRIWLFHDELADWMMMDDYRDAVELNANRLGIKARAAGINLVFISQRPDKDAFPMQLRANMTNRLVLKVADRNNSKLVLGEYGAENLLGCGHLAVKLSGEGKIMFAQVPFASDDEIGELAELIIDAWNHRDNTTI